MIPAVVSIHKSRHARLPQQVSGVLSQGRRTFGGIFQQIGFGGKTVIVVDQTRTHSSGERGNAGFPVCCDDQNSAGLGGQYVVNTSQEIFGWLVALLALARHEK